MSTQTDYMTAPLETLSIRDLTDAIGIAESAILLKTTPRAIYTQRNTGKISVERMQQLIAQVRTNEAHYRERLAIKRNMQAAVEAVA